MGNSSSSSKEKKKHRSERFLRARALESHRLFDHQEYQQCIELTTLFIEGNEDENEVGDDYYAPYYYTRSYARLQLYMQRLPKAGDDDEQQRQLLVDIRKDLDKAIELRPMYFECYINRGFLNKLTKNYAAAITDYNHVLCRRSLPPSINKRLVYLNRAQVFDASQKYKSAIDDYSQYLALSHPFVDDALRLGNVQRALVSDGVCEALNNRALCQLAMLSHQPAPPPPEQLDKIYASILRDFDLSIELIASAPGVFYFNRANFRDAVGDVEGAKKDLKRAVKMDRKNRVFAARLHQLRLKVAGDDSSLASSSLLSASSHLSSK